MEKCNTCKKPLTDKEIRHGDKSCAKCSKGSVPAGSRYSE